MDKFVEALARKHIAKAHSAETFYYVSIALHRCIDKK